MELKTFACDGGENEMAEDGAEKLASVIRRLFQTCADLESMFPGRPFTPDGHPMGSIGEVMAKARYGLRLAAPSTKGRDAYARDGRAVEVKATSARRGGSTQIGFSEDPLGVHVLVLRVTSDGELREEFNGPGESLLDHLSPRSKNGQRTISLARLRAFGKGIPLSDRLPVVDSSRA